MRTREQVQRDIDAPGLTGPTIPNADRLMLELLLDVRDLLAALCGRDFAEQLRSETVSTAGRLKQSR